MNANAKNKLLLAIDIDGTLIPNAPRPGNVEEIKKFRQLAKDLDAILVYPTGRNFKMTCEAIGEFFLPRPDFLITDNGSVIYSRKGDGWVENLEYESLLIKNNPDFDREKIAKILSKLPYLQGQEIEKQRKLKTGFYSDLSKQPVETVKAVEKILQNCRIDNIKIIYSQDLRNNVGILEILPDNISKLTGIEYLIKSEKSLKYNFSRRWDGKKTSIIFAGDEGNDLDVFASGIPSILVGNAREEIKTAVRNMGLNSIYFAKGNEVEGVLEGIESMFNEQ